MRPSQNGRMANIQLAAECGLLVILAALLVWKGLIPGWRILNTDFPNYYVAARLIREHYCLDRIYEWIWFQRAADHFGVRHQLAGFLGLTPFSAFPIIPFSMLSVMEAKRLWIVCNIALLAGSIEMLRRQAGLGYRRAWIIALCAVLPLRSSFLNGQMHILVLVVLAAAYVSHIRGRQISSGCYIAIAAALKIYPAFFCLYLAWKRRWRALGAAIACTGLCLTLTRLIAGPQVMRVYLFEQLPRLLQGESQNPFSPAITSSSALFHRLFLLEPEVNPHPVVASIRLFVILYPLWQALLVGMVLLCMRPRFGGDDREAIEWSMFLCLLMFLSSAPASYQFVVLIAAALPTMAVLIRQHRSKAALVYVLLYFLACNIRAIHLGSTSVTLFTPVFYLTLWCGVGLLLFYCVLLKPSGDDESRRSTNFFRRPAFRSGFVVLILWIIGGRSAWLHLKSGEISGVELIHPADGAYLRIDPVATRRELLYVAMLPNGYRVRNAMLSSDHYLGSDPLTDQLSYAASGDEVWIEEASEGGSRLVHFSAGREAQTCEISSGEDPVLSRDATRLAFLREDNGRGSLWAVGLSECASGNTAVPVRVTPASFDVRTLAAGSGADFIMSAVYEGREQIFRVSPRAEPQPVATGDGTVNSPALSSDGQMLVARQLISSRWQLALFDLLTGRRTQLSFGDCNAYSPSWQDADTLLYSTDCMRGMGLTTLARLKIDR